MTMFTKTLMLAAVATLSLAGAAMADGPSGYFPDYQAAKILAARQSHAGDVQMGGSDTNANQSVFQIGPFHSTPERSNALISPGGGN
jgi:hypothetical protein